MNNDSKQENKVWYDGSGHELQARASGEKRMRRNNILLLLFYVVIYSCKTNLKSESYNLRLKITGDTLSEVLLKTYFVRIGSNDGEISKKEFKINEVAVIKINPKLNYSLTIGSNFYFSEKIKIINSDPFSNKTMSVILKANLKSKISSCPSCP